MPAGWGRRTPDAEDQTPQPGSCLVSPERQLHCSLRALPALLGGLEGGSAAGQDGPGWTQGEEGPTSWQHCHLGWQQNRSPSPAK